MSISLRAALILPILLLPDAFAHAQAANGAITCSGTGDETARINGALSAGGKIQLSGICPVSAPLVMTIAGTDLSGSGTVKLTTAWTGGSHHDGAAIIANAVNLNIHDITIDGTSAVSSVAPIFSGIMNEADASGLTVQHVTIKAMRAAGINLANPGARMSHVKLLDNTLTSLGWLGIGLNYADNSVVDGNKITSTGFHSIEVSNSDHVKVSNNHATRASPPLYVYSGPGSCGGKECGFLMAIQPTATHLTVTHNEFDNNLTAAGDGIGLSNEPGTEFPGPIDITDNIVRNAGAAGLDVPGPGSVVNNKIYGTQGVGILISLDLGGTIQGALVSGNLIVNAGNGIGIDVGQSLVPPIKYKDLVITKNIVRDERSPKQTKYGIRFHTTHSTFENITVTGNDFREVSTRSIFVDGDGYPNRAPPIAYSDNQVKDPEQPTH